MAGHDVLRRIRQPAQGIVALEHVAQVEDRREAAPGFHVLVVVGRVRRKHHPAALCVHAHGLQPRGVPADVMQADAGGEILGSSVERDAALEQHPHHPDHVLRLERVGKARVAHVAPGDVAHLVILYMEHRVGEVEEGPDVVVVHVRDDDLAHRVGLDAEQRQSLLGRAQKLALAPGRGLGGEAGIHHDHSLPVADQPHEIIHRHRRVVGIAADEMLVAPRVAARVTDREYLVVRKLHVWAPTFDNSCSLPCAA